MASVHNDGIYGELIDFFSGEPQWRSKAQASSIEIASLGVEKGLAAPTGEPLWYGATNGARGEL
ncbi:hypothetical protein Ssi02_65670 [Sinosporangium siamense]|uniref:Uncharacterized protein n=1 Tax=Sinosporangium siamense TaxID=1367973 RepID=A0A919RM56_9ACTN|nr:hypothetical protein Ssi02_65670 [Sinosporangium siamense]